MRTNPEHVYTISAGATGVDAWTCDRTPVTLTQQMRTRQPFLYKESEVNPMPTHPFQPIPNMAEVAIRFTLNGQKCENVFAVRYAGPDLSPGDADDIGSTISAWVDASLQNQQSEHCIFTEIDIRDLVAVDAARYTFPGTNSGGSSPAPDMTNETALVITKNTAQGGQSGRGRIYHMGLTQAMCDGNDIKPVNGAAILLSWQTLLTELQTTSHGMYLISRWHLGVWRSIATVYAVLNLSLKDTLLDSQRRRKPGNGS